MPKIPKTRSTGSALPRQMRGNAGVGVPTFARGKAFQLELDQYYLRTLRHTDASLEFTQWMNDPDVVTGMNIPKLNMSVENLSRFIGTFDNLKKYIIGIFVKPDMQLIGFYQIDVDLKHRRGVITAAVGNRHWWGKGVFRTTARPMVDAFFETRDIDKMTLRVTSSNKKILYSLMTSSFSYEGCLKEEVLAPDGQRLDIHVFGRVKEKKTP